MQIVLPEAPILQCLMNKDLNNNVVEAVKRYMLAEYKNQYQSKPSDGYLSIFEEWTNDDWKQFLSRINWMFGQDDEQSLKKKVITQIRACKHFSVKHCDGYENQIFDSLMELFDGRLHIKDPLERFVYGAEIENAFKDARIRALSPSFLQNDKAIDPVWAIWNSLPEPDDKRILSEKIQEVCPKFSQNAIEHLAVKVTRNRVETKSVKVDKKFLSYKYRIYENSRDTLFKILGNRESSTTVSEQEVQSWIISLKESAVEVVKELSANYQYDLNSSVMVEGVILELFDTCFLSFDYAA